MTKRPLALCTFLYLVTSFAHAADEYYARAARAERIAELLGDYRPIDIHNVRFSPQEDVDLEILRDWQRTFTTAGRWVDEEVNVQAECRRALEALRATSEYYEQMDRCTRHWIRTRARVGNHPWSTFNWGKVFAERLVAAETEAAQSLRGGLARTQQLTEHALSFLVRGHGPRPILQAWASNGSVHGPLYGDHALEILLKHIATVSPMLAAEIGRRTGIDEISRAALGQMISETSHFFSYRGTQEGTKSVFELDGRDVSENLDGETRAHLLKRVGAYLSHYAFNVQGQPPSELRDRAGSALRLMRQQAEDEAGVCAKSLGGK